MDYVGPECLDESSTHPLPLVLVKILGATVHPRGDTGGRTFAAAMPTLSGTPCVSKVAVAHLRDP